MDDYWQKQGNKPLFPDIEWNKPEQKIRAGKLAIIGGNKLNFLAMAMSTGKAAEIGIGEVRAVMPASLKKVVPHGPEVVFAPAEASGGFSKEALPDLQAASEWADGTLIIGDLGKNAETAVVVSELIKKTDGRMIIMRDTVDLVMEEMAEILEKPDLGIIASFAQLQKIFRKVYYPKMLTFSMQLNTLVDTLHKFTVTYPCMVATLHQDTYVAAKDGKVITTPLGETKYSPVSIWSGELAVRTAVYWIWNGQKALEAAASAVL